MNLMKTQLKDFKDIESLQSGCIELDIDKLKHFRSASHNKYSDAIFHVLDRIYKTKSKYVERLSHLQGTRYAYTF